MSTPGGITRQRASNPRSGSDLVPTPSGSKVIIVNQTTPTRPAKRARKSTLKTSRRTRARLTTGATTSKSPQKSMRDTEARAAASREQVNDNEELSDASSFGDDFLASVKKDVDNNLGKSFIHRNAFDAYFTATSKPSQTSNNVFSQLVCPLSLEEHTSILRSFDAASRHNNELEKIRQGQEALFPRYALELSEGFNLLFFGFGSKRTLINTFALKICAPRGHVVIVNAFQPHVGIRDILARIEEVPGLTDLPLSLANHDAQAQRIYDFFLPPAACPGHITASRPLFLIVHNIDAPAMRSARAKSTLSLLAMSPRIHLVASIDHVHAQMLWSTAEVSARKHVYREGATADLSTTRGFAWAWHDLTTMQPYEAELAHIDVTRLGGKTSKASATIAERAMTETAAQHILASVNEKAKKLFALLAKTQLSVLEEGGEKLGQGNAVSYSALFNAARADFIAINDTSFKALLAEFRDHKLVLSNVGGGGEMLGIPLPSVELRRLLQKLSDCNRT